MSSKNNKPVIFYFILIIAIIGLITIFSIGFLSLKRKFLSVDKRIELIENGIKKHDDLYAKLPDYGELEYTKKFNEYITFLTKNAKILRSDLKHVYSKKPNYKFQTTNNILLGGSTKKDFINNIKKRKFRLADYEKFKLEAQRYLEQSKIYESKPHMKLGKEFSPTLPKISEAEEFEDASKNLNSAKSLLKSYSDRLKDQTEKFNQLKREYSVWKTDPNAPPLPEIDPLTGKKNPKPIINKEGKDSKDLNIEFRALLNKFKIEINELKKLKKEANIKLDISKSKFNKINQTKELEKN